MSKLNTATQSLAAAFTPESQRLRGTQVSQGKSVTSSGGKASLKLAGNEGPKDSLGNPGSPGYEKFEKEKKKAAAEEKEKKSGIVEYAAPEISAKKVRLCFGWEKLLLVQKKICEKTRALMVKMEGPNQYAKAKRSAKLSLKSSGCIIDLDLEEIRQKQETEAKEKKAKQINEAA